ncbi:unnamed protein product [Cylindrotheca closterium]|uniref:Uncharacterized protein n=1 Tax=Cylindrotheca closterium TaxID=2856 RepID=A0AAD2JGU5_9STRA|nr:unnamed protein product [Cylindrotheca closterium]
MPFQDVPIMPSLVLVTKDDRRLSSETAATEDTGSTASLPVNPIKIYSTMKQRAQARVLSETDEETPASPTQSVDSKLNRTSFESIPFSPEQAAKAAYAIMNGESVSEVDLLKDDPSVSEGGLNDETSLNGIPKSPTNVRPLGSTHSRSVGSISALSEVACDRLSMSSGSTGRRSYPSSVRILRTPDGRRLNRKNRSQDQPVQPSTSMPCLTSLDDSHHSNHGQSESFKASAAAPTSPGAGSLASSPERPRNEDDEERSASRRGVRILRTPDGRRRSQRTAVTRHSFAGVVTTPGVVSTSAEDAISPSSQVSMGNRRIRSQGALPTIPKIIDSSERGQHKEVKFSSVNVRYYERVVDVNPACSHGVAIGLGWKYNKSKKLSLNEFELQKGGVRYCARQLVLPRNVREAIAREFGYTQKDIAKSTRANLKFRNERKQTIDNLSMMPVEEKMEGAKRKMKKVFSFRRKRVA